MEFFGVDAAAVARRASVRVPWEVVDAVGDFSVAQIADASVRTVVDQQHERSAFPNYNTLSTELTPTQINLLSNFSSWMVQDPANAAAFTALYGRGPSAAP